MVVVPNATVKFLGIIFDRKLNWKPHVDYIIEKCKKRLNLMRAISGYHWGASKKSLLAIYKALSRSNLVYGDESYSLTPKPIRTKLKKLRFWGFETQPKQPEKLGF